MNNARITTSIDSRGSTAKEKETSTLSGYVVNEVRAFTKNKTE